MSGPVWSMYSHVKSTGDEVGEREEARNNGLELAEIELTHTLINCTFIRLCKTGWVCIHVLHNKNIH